MDLDDIDAPNQVPSRTSRFAPKSKPKPKPKPKPDSSQPEPRESVPKAEPREFAAAIPNKKENEEAVTAMVSASASASASNGDVKIEEEVLSEAKEESMEDVAIEEDAVVREIDVFFNRPVDDDTKVCLPLQTSFKSSHLLFSTHSQHSLMSVGVVFFIL